MQLTTKNAVVPYSLIRLAGIMFERLVKLLREAIRYVRKWMSHEENEDDFLNHQW